MVSLRTLIRLYVSHVRVHPVPEFLALLGIAAGVALLFAVQVANQSVTGSFEQLATGVSGRATLEVAARGPQGFDQEIFSKVKRLPDVKIAAPVVERRIAVRGPKGRRALTLFGFDERLKRMGGKLVTRVAADRDVSDLGLYLTEPTAEAIGVAPGRTVTVDVGERTKRFPLGGTAPKDEIGSLAQNPVAVAHLGLAQEIASMPKKITRILVAPVPGRESQARAALKSVSAGKLNVRASNTEEKLLMKAAAVDRQSGDLFSLVSILVGILLAYNAMLLTIMERRRVIASLHMLGATNRTIFASLLFDALVLGLAGSVLGVFLGDLLSRHVLNQVPDFLTAAFAIGNQRIIKPETILLSIAGGTAAAIAASMKPALNLLKAGPLDAFSGRGLSSTEMQSSAAHRLLLWGGIALIVLSIAISIFVPKMTLFSAAGVVVGMLLILHPLVTYLLTITQSFAKRTGSAALRISVAELAANPTRATALAAVGTLAVFAILTITGPTRDIERGMRNLTGSFFGNADLWITVGGHENSTGTLPFDSLSLTKRLKRMPEVESVRTYRGSFLDSGNRRLWIVAESRSARHPVAPNQIINGNLDDTTRHLRQNGWATVTEMVAKERNLEIGQKFSLPTPSGKRHFRLAATTTNYGWPPGVIVINARDYARAWDTQQASAVEIDLAKGVAPNIGKRAVERGLVSTSSLKVQTADERQAETIATTREGMVRLNQISNMVIAAAVLAIAAAMLASVWQRRQRLWGLVSMGMKPWQLYRTILFETGVILLLGCLIGAVFGFVGQAVGGRWLHLTASYSIPYVPAWELALQTIALTAILTAVAAALPLRVLFSTKSVGTLSSE